MVTTEPFGRALQQRPVRQEVTTSEEHLDERAIALTTRVATRPDRSQHPAVRLTDHAQAVRQRPPHHHPRHTGHPYTCDRHRHVRGLPRPDEHTSELQSLMRIAYAVFRLYK